MVASNYCTEDYIFSVLGQQFFPKTRFRPAQSECSDYDDWSSRFRLLVRLSRCWQPLQFSPFCPVVFPIYKHSQMLTGEGVREHTLAYLFRWKWLQRVYSRYLVFTVLFDNNIVFQCILYTGSLHCCQYINIHCHELQWVGRGADKHCWKPSSQNIEHNTIPRNSRLREKTTIHRYQSVARKHMYCSFWKIDENILLTSCWPTRF